MAALPPLLPKSSRLVVSPPLMSPTTHLQPPARSSSAFERSWPSVSQSCWCPWRIR